MGRPPQRRRAWQPSVGAGHAAAHGASWPRATGADDGPSRQRPVIPRAGCRSPAASPQASKRGGCRWGAHSWQGCHPGDAPRLPLDWSSRYVLYSTARPYSSPSSAPLLPQRWVRAQNGGIRCWQRPVSTKKEGERSAAPPAAGTARAQVPAGQGWVIIVIATAGRPAGRPAASMGGDSRRRRRRRQRAAAPSGRSSGWRARRGCGGAASRPRG